MSATVLVAARDADYMRFAAAVLTRAGFEVITTTFRLARVQRVLTAERPDVLVAEGGGEQLALLRLRRLRTVVLVVADGAEGPSRDDHAAVAKWGPSADLVHSVADAAKRPAQPRLTVVKG